MTRRPRLLPSRVRATLAVAVAVAATLLAVAPAVRADAPAADAPTPAVSAPQAASGPVVRRCGWFDNPTPGNATLVDAAGEWTVGQQGGHQAGGRWPRFPASRWVRTGHGSAGYGCACLGVREVPGTQDIAVIVSARTRPLAACRADPALKGSEPFNPLH